MSNNKKPNLETNEKGNDLLEFMEEIKNGKYSTIEKPALSYLRIREETYNSEGVYFYGLS